MLYSVEITWFSHQSTCSYCTILIIGAWNCNHLNPLFHCCWLQLMVPCRPVIQHTCAIYWSLPGCHYQRDDQVPSPSAQALHGAHHLTCQYVEPFSRDEFDGRMTSIYFNTALYCQWKKSFDIHTESSVMWSMLKLCANNFWILQMILNPYFELLSNWKLVLPFWRCYWYEMLIRNFSQHQEKAMLL